MGNTWRSSSSCSSADCVQVAFAKSSSCASVDCVEVSAGADEILVRDSKNPDGPVLSFNRDEWSAFLAGVRADEFDIN